jgi:hypothetical protein
MRGARLPAHKITLDATDDRPAIGKMRSFGGILDGVMQFASCESFEAIVNRVTNTKHARGICEPSRRGAATVIA